MIRRHLFQILIAYIVVSIFCLHSYALEKESHKAINEYIARNTLNGFSLDTYLKNHLGIQEGIEETFNHNKVWKWMGEGGKKEDEPFTRSANHFHSPLTDQGFSGVWGKGWFDGESALFWAQKEKGAQDTDEPDENYSWYDTRDYFYNALTSTTESEQDNYFAKTFRGLGQLMHLVTDMSVPEHTRDDGHYLGVLPGYEYYEKWVVGKDKDKNPNVDILPELGIIEIKDTQITPESLIYYDPASLPSESQFPEAPVPIANLFDTNQYVNGGNPAITLHDPDNNIATIGLSEYTNANFLSPGTMFTSDFPYPNKEDCILAVDQSNNRLYLSNAGGGEQVDHLAVVSFLYLWRTTHFPQYGLLFLPVGLDKFCYEEYAINLIPRAVGYSAGLLDYFFRGEIEISTPEGFLYSIIDGSITPQQFTYIKANLRNVTPKEKDEQGDIISYEEMGPGVLIAVAKYKKRTDYQPDLSTDPPTAGSREEFFSYSVSDSVFIYSMDSGTSTTVTFDFSNQPIPAGITDLYLQVIFKGTLGNEQNTGIAVGMKDINEPMHVCSWNSTDMVYLYGELYTAEEIRGDQDLLDLLPIGFNIDPYDQLNTGSAFSSDGNPVYYHTKNEPLPSARYSRIILLTDQPSFYIYVSYQSDDPPKDSWVEDILSGVSNQEDSSGDFNSTQVFTFREKKAHYYYGLRIYYPDATGYDSASWPPLAPGTEDPVETEIYP